MRPAAEEMRAALAEVRIAEPIAQRGGQRDRLSHAHPETIRAQLVEQVTAACAGAKAWASWLAPGVTCFAEAAPARC
jgi:hypothetical protein